MQEDTGNISNGRQHCGSRSFTVVGSKYEGESPRSTNHVFTTTSTTTTAGIIGNDMMAVARRIQERARVLEDEQRKAEATETVLLELRQKREKEQAINDKQRKIFLQKTNDRNTVELELFHVKDSIRGHQKQARIMEQATLESEERIRELANRRIETIKSFYGPNLANMETYIQVLETIVQSKEKAEETKRKRLEDLRAMLQDSKMKEENIIRKTSEVEKAIDLEERSSSSGSGGDTGGGSSSGTDDDGRSKTESNNSGNNPSTIGREDEEITSLSKRVREAIELRAALRKKRKIVQKKYDEANEDMLFWEEKSIQKMTRKKRRDAPRVGF